MWKRERISGQSDNCQPPQSWGVLPDPDALRHHAKNNPVVRSVIFPFGTKYTLDCHLPTPDQSNPCIRTVWEIRPDDERPRLITAHPLG